MIHQHGTFVSAAAAAEASIRQVLISGIAPSKPLPPLTVRLLHGRLLRLELLADHSHYLLRALSSSGLHLHALSLHSLFPDPSHLTLPFALKSASRLPNALPVGEQLHARSLKLPSHSNPHVLTSLLSLYAKCGLLDHARAVLDEMRCPHAVSWTALIAAYMNAGRNKEAVDTARDAFASGMRPDSFTATRLLTACARTVDLDTVEAVWRVADREGIATNLFMATAAVNFYIKGGEMAKAREVFDKMPHKDALAWGAMVKGYASNGYSQEAVELFFAMQTHGVTPDCYTVAGALSACTRLGALDLGRQVVGVVDWDEFLDNPVLGTALIDMYAKCGSTWDAWVVFWQMRERDIIVWNTMIFGLRMAGYGKAAFAIVAHMLKSGMQLCSVDMDWVGTVVALESANTSPATNRSGGGGGITRNWPVEDSSSGVCSEDELCYAILYLQQTNFKSTSFQMHRRDWWNTIHRWYITYKETGRDESCPNCSSCHPRGWESPRLQVHAAGVRAESRPNDAGVPNPQGGAFP